MAEPFDLFGFLEARTFPSEDVKVYTNEQLALEAVPLLNERKQLLAKDAKASTVTIDKKLKKIETDAEASVVTFHLRGIPQHVIDEAYKADDDKGQNRVLSAMLVGVTGPDGTTNTEVLDPDAIERLYGTLPTQGAHSLTKAVGRLLVASLAFDAMADAGFLAKS